jgi:UPF0755 protein
VLKRILKLLVFLVAVLAMLAVAIIPAVAIVNIISSPSSGKIQVKLGSPVELYYGLYLWLHQDELQKPLLPAGTPVPFTVYPGESPYSIAERLEEAGIISSAKLFYAYIRYNNLGHTLEAGDYALSPGMTIPDIVNVLQHGRPREITITVPEGWRMEQLADYLEKQGIMSAKEFLAWAKADLWVERYNFLKDVPEGATLEGYLFPDTYRLPFPASPQDLITRMLGNFEAKVTPEMRARASELGFTLHQVVTLASIVEKEAVLPEERPLIAGVFLNRLRKNMYLQADPTVQYAKGYDKATGRWWSPITIEEATSIQSPYNTYLNLGLPPGPICSPGLESIKAVLYPAQTDYLFFFSADGSSHIFSKTYEEHLEKQKQYGK